MRPAASRRGVLGCAALLLASAGLILAGCGKPAPSIDPRASLRATLSADSAGLGDPIALRITAVLPSGASPILPGDRSDSLGAWKILRKDPTTKREADGWVEYTKTITIAAYRLGEVGPDTLIARGARAGGDTLRLAYAPPRLAVRGKLAPGAAVDPASARDIRDVVSTGRARWPWIVLAALVALCAGIVLWRRLKRRRGALRAEVTAPGPTAEEEFEAAIARLLASGLLEQGFYREFYYEVSRAVRLYLEKVHGLPLLESTSSEVIRLLGSQIAGDIERDALREWLGEGDLVKYARMERLQAEARNYLDRSLSLVRLLAASRGGADAVGGRA